MIKFRVSNHAIERLQERFPELSNSMPEIRNWRRGDQFHTAKKCFADMLGFSEENKSYLNNTKEMMYLYEKYGYDKEYKFMELKQENLVFVLKKDRSEVEYTIATIMPQNFHHGVRNTKYNNIKKKEDIQKEVMSRDLMLDNFKSIPKTLADFGINKQTKKVKSYF